MTENKNRLFTRVIGTVLCIVMLWFGAAVTDYIMVIGLYREPIFCISVNADENGGTFSGLGYSYTIEGNFGRGPDVSSDPYGAHCARLSVLGFETKSITRGVHG